MSGSCVGDYSRSQRALLNWRREGLKSGPANVLNDRYEIRCDRVVWHIFDRQLGRNVCETFGGYKTMTDARRRAERLVLAS